MNIIVLFLTVGGILAALSPHRISVRISDAPALLTLAGLGLSAAASLSGAPAMGFSGPSAENVAALASAGLAALGFALAAQLRVSRLARRCPTSFRLTFGGAPIFLVACSLSAFVMLPQLSLASAILVGAALTLNGAAFDRRSVMTTSAPAAIKAAVRYESAAIIALGIPVAQMAVFMATASQPGEPALAPLAHGSLEVLRGFGLGGVFGLIGAFAGGAYRRRHMQTRARDGQIAMLSGIAAFIASPLIGADPIVATTAAGLLWGEQTSAAATTRLRLRRIVERSITPLAYFGFGAFAYSRIIHTDMLIVIFALAAVTVVRAGPRLAILQSPRLAPESQMFLAWFGGAPGAASALFTMTLIASPALMDADAVITASSVAVLAGIFAARLTSRPLVHVYLHQSALARRRRLFAN